MIKDELAYIEFVTRNREDDEYLWKDKEGNYFIEFRDIQMLSPLELHNDGSAIISLSSETADKRRWIRHFGK